MFRLRKSVIYAAAFIAAAAAITFGVIFVAKLNKELISEIPSPYYHDKTFRLNNWQYRWGDSPVEADGRFLWMDKSYDDGGWTDYEFPGRPANSGRYRSIWIKAVLPVLDMDHATFGLGSLKIQWVYRKPSDLQLQYSEYIKLSDIRQHMALSICG